MYAIKKVDSAALAEKEFSSLVLPQFHLWLSESPAELALMAFAAMDQDTPVGVVLASIIPAFKIAEVHSLFVAEPYRNKKIATRLMQALQKELSLEHYLAIKGIYEVETPFTPILEHIFNRLGWAPPQPFSFQCHFDTDFNAPWLYKKYSLPKGFKVFPWGQLTPKESQKLHLQQDQGVFPTRVSPFIHEDRIEPTSSLGLRYRGEVIGWMITQRLAPDLVQFSALYIDREFKFRGPAMRLLTDSIKLYLASGIRNSVIYINLLQVEPSWLKFVEKRLIPYANKVTHTNQTWCKISS